MPTELVQELFGKAVEAHPGQVAFDGPKRLTYAELDAHSNRVANALISHGVTRDSRVAIWTEHPADAVCSMLGVLKCSSTFVPIDPHFPEKRLNAMNQQIDFKCCLSVSDLAEKWLATNRHNSVDLICIDSGELNRQSSVCPLIRHYADDACSIYFTSGTSGKPKAILGRLGGIGHFAQWEIEALGVGVGTRVSQLASPSFDGFLKDVFVPLCAGGVVCAPATRSVVREPERLMDWIDIEGVEILHCVPSVLRTLLNAGLQEKYFAALRWVVLAGEALMPADVRRWREVFGERIGLLNLYGPTETTITKLFYFLQPGDEHRSSIPIGTPMPGAEAMIVNSDLQACPTGIAGEIYIRTPYGALGYWGDEELTKESFIANPFSQDANDIVYKTGDYGRLLKDGNIEFLGRRDQQVKVRGVRVELGEIENVLSGHGEVEEAAVVDREDGLGNKYLCAYVVARGEGGKSETLREYLSRHLPEWMVPTGWVEMEELPRTLNGKIDRKALAGWQRREGTGRNAEQGPRTPLEEMVAGLWSQLLRVPAIGRQENFFQLGGHSLLATQVISRLREWMGVEVPLRALFDHPTVEQMAGYLETELGAERAMGAIEAVGRQEPLPLSYAQQRMWVLEQLSEGSAAFHIPLGLRVKGELQVSALEQTLAEVVRRHEILRTRFPATQGQPRQVIEGAGEWKVAMVDLSGVGVEQAEPLAVAVAEQDARRGFDLGAGPLFRVHLLRLAHNEHILLCIMHHLIADAWSFEVLSEELNRLYDSYAGGRPSSLTELGIQYGDYAVWQQGWLQGENLQQRLQYWRKQLQGAALRLQLPQLRSRSAVQSFQGARLPVSIGKELVGGLRELGQQEGATLFMTLLAAFGVLLSHYSGQEDLVVGSVIANREQSGTEPLIGFFANTLLLRLGLAGGPSFRQLLGRVRETCLQAYAHQLPPELLSAELAPQGSPFDVWFQLEPPPRQRMAWQGIDCQPFPIPPAASRFELSLVLQQPSDSDSILGHFEFDSSLFTQTTAVRLIDDYTAIIENVIAKPDFPCVMITLANQRESAALIQTFSASL